MKSLILVPMGFLHIYPLEKYFFKISALHYYPTETLRSLT